MDFLTLDPESFTYGVARPVAPLVRGLIAHNPSKFTYYGTGTYIVGERDVVVIDPGPKLDSHRDALYSALEGCTVRAILVTHCHSDHSPLSAWLAAETGAPTVAFGPHEDDRWDIGPDPMELAVPEPDPDESASETATDAADGAPDDQTAGEVVIEESIDRGFVPEIAATTGDRVAAAEGWTMTALHTPGHTSNHLCYALDDGERRTLFTGDHVMGWSTTVVSPPDGDMSAYIESLRLVAGRSDDVLIPTHGPPIDRAQEFVGGLLAHRLDREDQVLAAVRDGCGTVAEIVLRLYTDVDPRLRQPAGRSVLAHLGKLAIDGLVVAQPPGPPRLDSSYNPA
jgi:glyoxylase-like metal-dependent hydrolase (beta-lactamase superfamily II)